jgi:hypothetical protein
MVMAQRMKRGSSARFGTHFGILRPVQKPKDFADVHALHVHACDAQEAIVLLITCHSMLACGQNW